MENILDEDENYFIKNNCYKLKLFRHAEKYCEKEYMKYFGNKGPFRDIAHCIKFHNQVIKLYQSLHPEYLDTDFDIALNLVLIKKLNHHIKKTFLLDDNFGTN